LTYAPDVFQIKAMDSIDADASVLVAAPTGSGKTLIAEYAIARARSLGLRAFYTTPIKALSNQKFRDLQNLYGAHKVGLVTGDNAVNPEAPVVVMTTEVLRNMIYSQSTRLDDLGVVILDEVHYLQDAYRGPVWEEVVHHQTRKKTFSRMSSLKLRIDVFKIRVSNSKKLLISQKPIMDTRVHLRRVHVIEPNVRSWKISRD
jgi:superfamily II RNA helicase